MSNTVPDWLRREVEEFITELPDTARQAAQTIWETGEYVIEPWTTSDGIRALAVDLGGAELLTCEDGETP